MSLIVISPTSPVLVWLVSLLRAASIRESAEARMARTRRLDVDRLSAGEVHAWGVAAVRSRGAN